MMEKEYRFNVTNFDDIICLGSVRDLKSGVFFYYKFFIGFCNWQLFDKTGDLNARLTASLARS